MKNQTSKVKTSILAKIALSKLERDVKTCWEHLERPESLQSKESVDSALKIAQKIQVKAEELTQVIGAGMEWTRLGEQTEEALKASKPSLELPFTQTTAQTSPKTPKETQQDPPKKETNERSPPPKPPKKAQKSQKIELQLHSKPLLKRGKVIAVILFLLIQAIILSHVFNSISSLDQRFEKRTKSISDDYVNLLKEVSEQKIDLIGLKDTHLKFCGNFRVDIKDFLESGKKATDNTQSKRIGTKNQLERFQKLAKMSPKLKEVLVNLPRIADFERQKLRLKNSGRAQHRPVLVRNGILYIGNWFEDKFNGFGVLYRHKERSYYEGYFVDGKEHGAGRKVYENGSVVRGYWTNGELLYSKNLENLV